MKVTRNGVLRPDTDRSSPNSEQSFPVNILKKRLLYRATRSSIRACATSSRLRRAFWMRRRNNNAGVL